MKKKTFAIIGKPLSHSLSPVLHNYWFKKYNIEANYEAFEINDSDIEKLNKLLSDSDDFIEKFSNTKLASYFKLYIFLK